MFLPRLGEFSVRDASAAGQLEADDMFNNVLGNKKVKHLSMQLVKATWLLPYHKLVFGSPVSATLREVWVSVRNLSTKQLDLMGKALCFNTELKALSLYNRNDSGYKRHLKFLMGVARSRIRVLHKMQCDLMTFFYIASSLRVSNLVSLQIDTWRFPDRKHWLKYLVGKASKLQRSVDIMAGQYSYVFSDDETNFLSAITGVRWRRGRPRHVNPLF